MADNVKRKRARVDKALFSAIKLVIQAGNTKELFFTYMWLVTGVFVSITAVFEKNFYNKAAEYATGAKEAFNPAAMWLLIWGAVVIAVNVVSFISTRANTKMWSKMEYYICERLMYKVSRIKLEYFDKINTYTKLGYVKGDLSARISGVINAAFQTVFALIQFVTVAIIILNENWLIAVIILAGAVPSIILKQMQTEANYYNEQENSHEVRFQTYLSWVLFKRKYMKEMRFGNLYDYINDKFNDSVIKLHKTRMSIMRKYSLANGGANLISYFTIALSLILISVDIYHGRAGIGSFMLVYKSTQRMQAVFASLFINLITIGNEGRYIEDFYDVMKFDEEDYKEEVSSEDISLINMKRVSRSIKKRTEESIANNIDIRFENVTFCYPDTERIILNNVSVEIKQGEKVAVVGENGSGKSTFIALLCGLYAPNDGTVYVNDMDITDNLGVLRGAVSCTFQNFGHYDMSIADNIRIGDLSRKYSDEEVIEALEKSGAYDFVRNYENGINTNMGTQKQGGMDLSGGQWQKVAISRNLIKRDARFLILDEPTAALDPLSEVKLYEDFSKLTGDRTVVLISHRLGATRLADRILVFDEGRIVEEGSHDTLMARNGLYAKMYRAQSQWYVA